MQYLSTADIDTFIRTFVFCFSSSHSNAGTQNIYNECWKTAAVEASCDRARFWAL